MTAAVSRPTPPVAPTIATVRFSPSSEAEQRNFTKGLSLLLRTAKAGLVETWAFVFPGLHINGVLEKPSADDNESSNNARRSMACVEPSAVAASLMIKPTFDQGGQSKRKKTWPASKNQVKQRDLPVLGV
jgi:hypothetical protein